MGLDAYKENIDDEVTVKLNAENASIYKSPYRNPTKVNTKLNYFSCYLSPGNHEVSFNRYEKKT